jgi:prepilin-type N-terminal cleavage/methylation domain-containing protein
MQLRRIARGFTLTEIAVVVAIVALLIGGVMMTFSAQVEQRNREETQRRLHAAVDALLGFAVVNGRLPCPAAGNAFGEEDPAGGGNCATNFNGFLPARTVGFQPTDPEGYGLDVWGNRIRYAVSNALYSTTSPQLECRRPNPADPNGDPPWPWPFTSRESLKKNGVGCRPNDLDVCTTATCAARVVSTRTAVLVVYSTGKNGALPADPVLRPNENQNLNGTATFVSRPPDPSGANGGEFDDLVVVVPVGVFYSRLIAAGLLP